MECAPREVHAWRIHLDCSPNIVATLGETLRPDEQFRASRFVTQQLRNRWIVARGALRSILASYFHFKPNSLVFQPGTNGKPSLTFPVEFSCFNLSHTGNIALLAIAESGDIGIDAEAIRPDTDITSLSQRFFASSESEEILCLPQEKRTDAFFACWTRKESYVKALGIGLSARLDSFRVNVNSNESPKLISADFDRAERWSLIDISEPGVAATIAVEGAIPTLKRFDFNLKAYAESKSEPASSQSIRATVRT